MIDIETEIFNIISQKVRENYPNAFITGEYVKTPSSMPCISIIEIDNQMYNSTQSTGSLENHAQVVYEVNVYSNKKVGKKSECKDIIACIDNEFERLGFTRTFLNPVPNEIDATIYRIVARYKAVVSKNNVIYRR